jgi:hypothetical protein
MIWIDTDKEITSYVLSATEPSNPTEGMVWVVIGDSCSTEISFPVGGEWITICPLSVKQYVSGAWEIKNAKTYQDGGWINWVIYVLQRGKDTSDTTGGWLINSDNTITTNDDGTVTFQRKGTSGRYCVPTNRKFDLTGYSILEIEVTALIDGNSAHQEVGIVADDGSSSVVSTGDITATGRIILDISAVSGEYSVGLWAGNNAGITIGDMVLRG